MSVASLISRYKIDLDLGKGSAIGQPDVTFGPGAQKSIERLVVARYSRFGNNFFQILHAMAIAARLRIACVSLQGFGVVQPMPFDPELGFEIVLDGAEASDADASGGFYAPFGFEALVQTFDDGAVTNLIRRCRPHLYAGLVANAPVRNAMVLHFRGGDIFSTHIHPWYVQPPASFYLEALDHALGRDDYDVVQLMSEDRLNPALPEVERGLEARGIPFVFRLDDLSTDLSSLLGCRCLVASYGTFCEAAALLSSNLESYYAFRAHSSQADLRPFFQSKVGPLLVSRGTRCFIIDDYGFDYIWPRTWQNSEPQRAQMIAFPGSHLRIYEHLGTDG